MHALMLMPSALGVGSDSVLNVLFGSPSFFGSRIFLDLGLPMDSSANLDIVSYETLAQIALVLVFSSACVGGRMRISIPSWTDNSGTEAVCNKTFHDGDAPGIICATFGYNCMAICGHS